MNANSTSLIQCLRKMVAPQACAHDPDPQLLERFLTQRSEAAFAALVQRHGPMVLNVCRRVLHHAEDAEDAFQATFLVLARKANSIRKHESVGSWLHGVAYRVSRMCKIKEARRQACQREMPLPQSTDALDDIQWRELRSLLDEELGKLPEKYRAPLVLCYLEGRTRDEAAQQLGVSKAVFRRRLEYGRDRLGRQLARRGVTLSAAMSAPLLIDAGAQAALPPLLAANTVRAGLATAMGNTVSGIVSAQVVALAEGGIVSLLAKKATVALVLLVSLMLGAGGLLAHRAVHSGTFVEAPAGSPAPAPQSPPARSASKDQVLEIKGRVLAPDGKPFAGASLFLLSDGNRKNADLPRRGTTDKEGRFRFRARPADFGPQGKGVLAATAKGFGLDWIEVDAKATNEEVTLRLVADDVPIVGRVLDLEGKPIAGVTVQVRSVRKQADGSDLAAWIERNRKTTWIPNSELDKLKLLLPAGLDVQATVASGVDGRFRLSGFGRERILRLALRAPNLADADFLAVTRAGPAKGWVPGHGGLYAARFDVVAEPCKPIIGTVREKGSGKPLEGITVAAAAGWWSSATTDKQGRYRIVGLAKHEEYAVGAGGMPYVHCPKNNIADTPGLEPLIVNFELARGIAVKGRLIDKTTGKPVRGHVDYLAMPDNPHLKDFPDQNIGGIRVYDPGKTAADGSFTVVAIPGPGRLAAQANAVNQFAHTEGADDVSHAEIRINVSEEDAKSTTYEIALEPAGILKGSVLGPDNQTLAGAYTAGCSPIIDPAYHFLREKLDSNTFTVGGVKPGQPRLLTFYHREKKLGKVLVLQGDEAKPLAVRLEPLAAIAGRILDAKGRPWAGLKVLVSLTGVDKTYPPEFHWGPSIWLKLTQPVTTTDREGKFRIDGLLAGLKYDLHAYEGTLVLQPDVALPYRAGDLTIEPGKTKDLGDLKSKLMPGK